MLIVESENAKLLRSKILNIAIEIINDKTRGGTKYTQPIFPFRRNIGSVDNYISSNIKNASKFFYFENEKE